MPLDEVGRYPARVEAVTPAQVQAFTAQALDPKAASVIIAGDAKAFAADLRAKLPNLEVIPSAELDLASSTLRK